MAQAATSQRGHHGSRNAEEETRERLSSLIRQKGLTGGGGTDCYWVLLAESSTDRFVTLERIHESCWIHARNDEFQLVAVGSAASEDGCVVFWPGAKDLACVVHKIMRKNRYAEYDSKIARCGLPIYHLDEDGCKAWFSRPEEQDNERRVWSSTLRSLLRSLRFFDWRIGMEMEMEMQMLSRVLKPPSVLGAVVAAPSLLAQGPLDDTASSDPLALVSLGLDNNHSETAGYAELPELVMYSPFGTRMYCFSGGHHRILNQGYTYTSGDNMNMIMTTAGDGNNTGGHSLRNLLQELVAAAPRHVFTRSSGGGRGRNGVVVVPAAAVEFLVRHWWRDYDLEAQRHLDYDLEAAGRQAHRAANHLAAAAAVAAAAADGARRRASRAATPVQEPSEVAKMLEGVMVQAYAAFLPACVTAYPLLIDAPDHIKFAIFGGLALTTVGLFVGLLSRSAVRRGLAIRLVSFSAVAVLALSVASQLSSRTFIALTALVAVALNLIILLLQ